MKSHSTDYALIKLISIIYYLFNQKKYTLDVSIDLSKALDIFDHNIFFNKLVLYANWFSNYSSKRKQFVQVVNLKTSKFYFICVIFQG